MPTNAPEVSLSTDFQTCSIARSVLRQIASLHHRPPCFFALIGDTHGFPGDALRMANVLCGPLPSLLMNQVQITESRFPAGPELEEECFRGL